MKNLMICSCCLLVAVSAAWAADDTRAGDGSVPAIRSADGKAPRLAQRRRRPRRGTDAATSDNPYAEPSERGGRRRRGERPGRDAGEPTPSKVRSEDPRTNGENGGRPAEGNGRTAGATSGGTAEGSMQRSDRLDFDERLIQGQTARSGAVYLFSRPPRDLPELVKLRKSFRAEISRTVVGREPLRR